MARSKEHYSAIRVLVIEDEPYIRQIICRLLRQIGFTLVEEAEDGTDGFKEILRTKPKLVICDIHMEPVDGITFLAKLRKIGHPELERMPVIFLTSDTAIDVVKRSKELNVDGYLAKPVSMATLKQRLDDVLDRRGM